MVVDSLLVGSESIGLGPLLQGPSQSLLIGSLEPAPHLAIKTTPREKAVSSDHNLLPGGLFSSLL